MAKWPIGVFTSIDAGLGVKLEVAHELGIPTIQLHAPAQETRTAENAAAFLARLDELDLELTAVFGGFEGESYADIPTVVNRVGLVPPQTRATRTQEMKEIADFARMLNCDVVALHLGFIPHDTSGPLYGEILDVTRDLLDHCKANNQSLHLEQTVLESAFSCLFDPQHICNAWWLCHVDHLGERLATPPNNSQVPLNEPKTGVGGSCR